MPELQKVSAWIWWVFGITLMLLFVIFLSIKEAGNKFNSETPTVNASAAGRESLPVAIERKEWEPGVAVNYLFEALTVVDLKVNEWSGAFEGPAAGKIRIDSPSPRLDLWFSSGEIYKDVSHPDWDWPARIFRIRDNGASGKAVIKIFR